MKLEGEPEWLVPFKGRHWSGPLTQNFLWKHGNVYIMDNHRAAMWCWVKELDKEQHVNIFHIDEHYDALYSQMKEWLEALPRIEALTIGEYLEQNYLPPGSSTRAPIVRWDNYLSLFLEHYGDQVGTFYCVTHRVGDRPKWKGMLELAADRVPANIKSVMENAEDDKWIVNVDLDYFFCNQAGRRKPLFSVEYIETIFGEIRECHEKDRITCLTLCLTPDEGYTGGWEQAEALCEQVCRILGVDFSLPASRPDHQEQSRLDPA